MNIDARRWHRRLWLAGLLCSRLVLGPHLSSSVHSGFLNFLLFRNAGFLDSSFMLFPSAYQHPCFRQKSLRSHDIEQVEATIGVDYVRFKKSKVWFLQEEVRSRWTSSLDDSQDSDELQTHSSTSEIYLKFFHLHLHLITWSYPQNPRNLTTSL